jgi:BirA family transcriptional regulator, biotin operon repressor / biotin---[acetyl-CoA-carboxylase] ligase
MSTLDAELISALRDTRVHLPGGELAALLRVSPEIVASRVQGLCEAGFEIENRPGLGYRLLRAPDRLIADDLKSRLGQLPSIRDVIVFEETDSTNEQAVKMGEAGAPSGLAIFAERQTAGRGRFGRRWESASHRGLWFSLLLRPSLSMAHWPRLTTWAAAAMADAIEQTTGLAVQIKWPNDLQSHGRKLAGILIETGSDRAGSYFAVVGIGVNVNHSAEDFPEELRDSATSLQLETRRTIDRTALAVAILRTFHGWLDRLADDFPSVIDAACRRSSLIGKTIAIHCQENRVEGRAVGLDSDGKLLVEFPDGTTQTFGAGEASIMRTTK